jgi:hypothetical protein
MQPKPIALVVIDFENGNELLIEEGRMNLVERGDRFPLSSGWYPQPFTSFPGGEYHGYDVDEFGYFWK